VEEACCVGSRAARIPRPLSRYVLQRGRGVQNVLNEKLLKNYCRAFRKIVISFLGPAIDRDLTTFDTTSDAAECNQTRMLR
jgi:hypothetical protein